MKNLIKLFLVSTIVAFVSVSCSTSKDKIGKEYVTSEAEAEEFIQKAFTLNAMDEFEKEISEVLSEETIKQIQLVQMLIDDDGFRFSMTDEFRVLPMDDVDDIFYEKEETGEKLTEDEAYCIAKTFYVRSGSSNLKVEKVGNKLFKCFGNEAVNPFTFEIKKTGKRDDGRMTYELVIVNPTA